VDSIEFVKESGAITEEWFGLVLLPLVSFSADGAIAMGYFIHRSVGFIFKLREPEPPTTLAKAEAIDLSIQFLLLWMPLLTLIGWWTNKPFNLLFGV
jgi:Ca2+:H+ antiporter